jgi:hypothetical protein
MVDHAASAKLLVSGSGQEKIRRGVVTIQKDQSVMTSNIANATA